MDSSLSEFFRIDPLTGCKNYLGFLETLANDSIAEPPGDRHVKVPSFRYWIDPSHFDGLLFVDMNDLAFLNETRGWAHGDSALRWLSILLQEESQGDVFRICGSQFAVLLRPGSSQGYQELMERILQRMEREARQLGFPGTAAHLVLVSFDRAPISLEAIFLNADEAMEAVKQNRDCNFILWKARDPELPPESNDGSDLSSSLSWLTFNLHHVLQMGRLLDEIQHKAYTDVISGLPNMSAALVHLEQTLQSSAGNHKTFSMLMIDGDNLRQCNNQFSYAVGDENIRKMSAVFQANLRPNDFVARWRTGDEFIVILPDTPLEGAQKIGERFRLAVKAASVSWLFPMTISIGVAGYPVHGEHASALIDTMEAANKQAKQQGRDQVVLAGEPKAAHERSTIAGRV